MQRFRFFSAMQLSVPIDLYRYCPGGSVVTIVFVATVADDRPSDAALTQPLREVSQIENQLPEFHTRLQTKHFNEKLANLAKLKPALVDFIYKELTLDASHVSHPETQQRFHLISLGETGLVADLWELNPGRPSDKSDIFFQKLGEVVETITAVDHRRNGEEHLSRWVSLDELIQRQG